MVRFSRRAFFYMRPPSLPKVRNRGVVSFSSQSRWFLCAEAELPEQSMNVRGTGDSAREHDALAHSGTRREPALGDVPYDSHHGDGLAFLVFHQGGG